MSGRVNKSHEEMRRLENDFNNGQKIDLTRFQNVLEQTRSMGFSNTKALEAALVCNTEDIGTITEYFFLDDAEKMRKYEERVLALRRATQASTARANANRSTITKGRMTMGMTVGQYDPKKAEKDRNIRELRRSQIKLERYKLWLADVEQQVKNVLVPTPIMKYQEFLRGICADDRLNESEVDAVNTFKRKHNISPNEHERAIDVIQVGKENWDSMVANAGNQGAGANKCKSCGSGEREFLVWPSMYVCLCENCFKTKFEGTETSSSTRLCPVTGTPVTKITKVYM